jgi:hypothetical protein
MIVSLLQFIIELPDSSTIKEKRRIVKSIKERARSKFRVSCAEVDLQDSLRFAQIGAALVSNSAEFGSAVMHRIIGMVESEFNIRLHDSQIHTEHYEP